MLLFLMMVLSGSAFAQPDLNFKRIRLEWPYVEVYFSVGCNGIKNYSLQPTDVLVYEDGRRVTDYGLWCPDPTSRCPISVGLVFDASDSMTGEGNLGAKNGGATFIGNMDSMVDEACVIHFNQSVWVYQHMTTDTVALKTAVSLLPTFGATALWDGIWTALAIVQNNGHNQCRAVIVLSDGEDNSSTRHGLPDIIEFAVRHNIRVFPIGYGEHIAEDDLRMLAELSGGVYYQTPNASELAGIYREISTILYDYFQECVLTYEPRCGDDKPHDVELKIAGICGGDASFKRSYVAPRDSSTYRDKHIAFGEATGMGGGELKVPIELRTPYYRELLYPLSIMAAFDRKNVQLVRVETPPGTLLEGMNLHIADLSYGGTVRIPESRVLDGAGVLAYAVFKTTLHSRDAEYPINAVSAEFDKGCMIPVIENGVLHVTTSRPVPRCDLVLPASLAWNGTRHRYEPDPLVVRIDLRNEGTVPATGGVLSLQYDTRVFDLLDPTPQKLLDTLHASGQASLQWRLAVRPQANAATGQICVLNNFTGIEAVQCCAAVEIPAAGMLLDCALSIPSMQYQASSRTFVPNPFDLEFRVHNPGVIASGSLSAMLQLPEGLYIESGETYEKALPSSPLAPGEESSLSWRLRVVSHLGGEVLPVRIELRNEGVVYRSCVDTLTVPAIPPVFVPEVNASGAIVFCQGDSVRLDAGEGYMAYRWNTGEKTRYLVVHGGGAYQVTVRDVQGNVGQSAPFLVTVHPRPGKPVITRTGNRLSIDFSGTIVWLRNGVPIDGANSPQLDVRETGTYTVRVENEFGCENASDPFAVNILAAPLPAAVGDVALLVHPQPARSTLQARLFGVSDGATITLRVHDLLGRVVIERLFRTSEGLSWNLSVESLRPGLYLLSATWSGGAVTTKFIVE